MTAGDEGRRRDLFLMGRVAAGDRDSFAELFDRHAPTVLGALLRAVGNRAEAEEVLQEVFLQAWRQADRYLPERASPRGWLLVLARSRALDRVRARAAAQARDEDAGAGPTAVDPAGTAPLEAAERSREVQRALAALPAEQRRAIELAFYGGLTQVEIAARLGAPLGTVKSRMLLGMRKLREALAS